MEKKKRFAATPAAKMSAPRSGPKSNGLKINNMIDFKDDKFYYYMFYLGQIENVPLQTKFPTVQWNGDNPRKEIFILTVAEAKTIEKQSMYATSVTDEQFKEKSGSVKVTTSVGFPVGVGIEASVEAGYTEGWGKSKGETWENSYTQAEKSSKEETHRVDVSFDSTNEIGYYRYVLFGSIDVYALVIYDPAKPKNGYTVKTISDVAVPYYGLDYSTSSRFDDQKPEELPFDLSLLDGLGYEPKKDYSTSPPPPSPPPLAPGETKFSKTFLEAKGERNIRIKGDDGSEHADYITTKFDLTKLKKAGYKSFSIVVKYNVKGIDESNMQFWIIKGHGREGKESWFYKEWDHGGSGKDQWWGGRVHR